MRPSAYLLLLRRQLSCARSRSAVAILSTALASGIWVVASAAGWIVSSEVAPRVEAAFPANRMVARPQEFDLLVFRLGPQRIAESVAEQAAGWPGVRFAARQAPVTFPIRADVYILGSAIATDAVVVGVDTDLVEGDVAQGKAFGYSDAPDALVPVMVSRYFLDMYNVGYARSNSLPRLNDAAAVGMRFDLVLGETLATGPRARARRVKCEIVGLTRDASLICVVTHHQYVRQWNEWYHGKAAEGYSALHISVESSRAFADVEQRLMDLGLRVESNRELLERARLLTALATGGAIAFGALVAALAGMNLLNTFTLILMQQRRQIGMLRAIGAPPGAIMWLLAGEALSLTGAGCALGVASASGLFLAFGGPLRRAVASFEFLGELALWPAFLAGIATSPVVIVLVCLFVAPQIARVVRRPIPELLQ